MDGSASELDFGALVAVARERHPDLGVDAGAFERHLRACVEEAGSGAAAYAGDLYVAFACAQGDRRALALFEQRHLSLVGDFIAHLRQQASFVDDVCQCLRERMLVGPVHGTRPTILSYCGRGPLGGWVRVAAVRQALDLLEKDRARRQAVDEPEDDLLAATVDPELVAIRRRHLPQVREAFRNALGDLDPSERTLLRLHLVDGLNIGSIGEIFGKSRATVGRMVISCRQKLLGLTRRNLRTLTGGSEEEVRSLLRALRSQLDFSIRRHLRPEPAGDSTA
jgi:RNA polymerase sigma-70 factor (ECF subfamily)